MAGKRRGRHPQNDLNTKKVAALIRKKEAGRHFDGGGLHLFIKPGGASSWVLRTTVGRRRRDLGVGSAVTVALAEAREKAGRIRAVVRAGGDPLAEKQKGEGIPTFEAVARAAHAEHSLAWRSSKHAAQWLSTLETYAFPEIGKTRVDLVGLPELLRVLSPIWLTRPETARRVRQRLRTVLDVASAGGYRSGENPVGGVLAKALPRQPKERAHHAAMPYAQLPMFFAQLGEGDARSEVTRLALRFLILTATRTGEVIGARRSEIDIDAAEWTIPAIRMKAGREHRQPLSKAAIAIVQRAIEFPPGDNGFLFPGNRAGRPLSNMALLMLMRRAGLTTVPHGFRSSFSDWCAETTGFPAEVREMALAHAIGDKTEAAYRRGDLFAKRRKLMEAWASFVTKAPAGVTDLRRSAGDAG